MRYEEITNFVHWLLATQCSSLDNDQFNMLLSALPKDRGPTVEPIKPAPSQTTLGEAHDIINGARRQSYGPAKESFARIAKFWSAILGSEITSSQVALCMIAMKLSRETNRPSHDNRVDICGYATLLDEMEQ